MRELRLMRQWRELEDFLPPLRIASTGNDEIASLPDEILLEFLRDSIITFTEDTKVVRQYLEIKMECGVCEYPLVLDTCEQIIGIGEVVYGDDCRYDCAGSKAWTWGDVDFRLSEDDDVLLVNRAPDDDGRVLQIELFTAPKRDACKCDEILYQRYKAPITNLALERIHLMTNVPWGSTGRAQYFRQLYAEHNLDINERRLDRGKEHRYLLPQFKVGRAGRRF